MRESDRENLGWLEAEEQPLLAALTARSRWLYILKVASAALEGKGADASLPQVMANPTKYLALAGQRVSALSHWLAQHGLDAA